jgi:hypothetical protein
LAGDCAGYAWRKLAVTRDNDAAGLAWMLVHIMVAAMALNPAIPLEPHCHFRSVRLRLGHGEP